MAYKNVSFQEAKQQAMLELGFVDKRLKYRDAEEQNDFYGNNKDFPSLDRFKKKKIIVEKWEDQPCDLRHPFWKYVKSRQQPRSDRNRGQEYRLDTQNRYESLSEEEDHGNFPTQSREEDIAYADKVKSNQKNNRRIPNKEKNIMNDKRQKHTDYDIEQLLQWIKEEELEDVVLKRLENRGRYSSEQMEKMWGKVDSNLKRLDRNVQRQIRSYNYSELPKHITGDNLVDEELEEMRRKEEERKRAFLYRNKRPDAGYRRQNFRGTDNNETYHNKHENKDWNQPNKVDKLMPEWKKAEEQPTTSKPKEREDFAAMVFELPALPQVPVDDNWDSDAPKEERDQVKTVKSMATIEEKEEEKTELEAFIPMEEVGANIEIIKTEKSADCNSVSEVPSTSTGITVNNC
ncbi:uncharacterized protein LOC128884594 [Hylaeus volcanicus]|uniref:uncharacterized protein LOC128884594 n=1 Tax=Hylaeus volcanicus TaxID=313075 RepID=UPI0023B7F49E|nr:uncharacterized protein LOC128884594 [Hylaeus volcanicus]